MSALPACRAARADLAGPHPLREKRRATRRLLIALDPSSPPADWWAAHCWLLVDALEIGDRTGVDVDLRACRRIVEEADDDSLGLLTRTWEATISRLSGKLGDPESDDHPQPETVDALRIRSAADRARLAEQLWSDGRPEEASFELDRLALDSFAHVPRDHEWLASLVRIARVCCDLERADVAVELRELLGPLRDRTVVVKGPPLQFLGAVAHHTGALAVTVGELDAALVDLAAAAEMYDSLGARPWLAATRCEQARALIARGGHGDDRVAGRLLEHVEEEAVDMGLQALSERAQCLRREPPALAALPPTFYREDGGWKVAFGTTAAHLHDSKGMHSLHHLLGRRGFRVAATTIVREVLAEVVDDRERARVNVTRQIRGAIRAIGEHLPELAAHLNCAVVTGRECSYRPPDALDWRL